ncbi:MAG TPA: hypothetical protein VKD72_03715, partial [Gemmataceae bacterium]|nr:hypothetical protein [Gemmataceae bacterium]
MSLNTAWIELNNGLKLLREAWDAARPQWKDSVARDFEAERWAPLEAQVALDHAGELPRRPLVLLDGLGQQALPAADRLELGLGLAQAALGLLQRQLRLGGATALALV